MSDLLNFPSGAVKQPWVPGGEALLMTADAFSLQKISAAPKSSIAEAVMGSVTEVL